MSRAGFLTVEEVAQNLKVTRQTVSKYIKMKELNAIKINKSYRITINDFENFVNSNSTAQEPSISYLRRTKNCTLQYSGKSDEFEVVHGIFHGELRKVRKSNSRASNRFIFGDNYFVLKNS